MNEVYYGGQEVTVKGGNTEEGWAIIQFPNADSARDVDIGELKAEGGYETIKKHINKRETFMGESYDEHLPLSIRYPSECLLIQTIDHATLFEVDFWAGLDGEDEHTFITSTVMGAIQTLDMAHRQPRRALFRNREVLD